MIGSRRGVCLVQCRLIINSPLNKSAAGVKPEEDGREVYRIVRVLIDFAMFPRRRCVGVCALFLAFGGMRKMGYLSSLW